MRVKSWWVGTLTFPQIIWRRKLSDFSPAPRENSRFWRESYCMNFYDWMIHKGLSKSSARSYDGALRDALSEWAMNSGLISAQVL